MNQNILYKSKPYPFILLSGNNFYIYATFYLLSPTDQ